MQDVTNPVSLPLFYFTQAVPSSLARV